MAITYLWTMTLILPNCHNTLSLEFVTYTGI